MNGFHAPLFVVALVLVEDHCAGRNTKFHKVLKLQAHVINFSVILRMCKMLSHLRIRQLHKFGDCLASETHCQVFANLKVNQVCRAQKNLLDLWVSLFFNKIHMDVTRVRLFKSETVFWKFAQKKHTHTHTFLTSSSQTGQVFAAASAAEAKSSKALKVVAKSWAPKS